MIAVQRMREWTARHPEADLWLRAMAIFALVRLWYRAQGVAFWYDSIFYFFQLLDPMLLRDRLAESLWHLHAQPPLWNLLTGLVLKAAPGSFPEVLEGLFLATGFATMMAVCASLRRMGLSRNLALGIAAAFASSPQFLTFENYFMYPHLVGVLLAVSACAFLRSEGRPGPWMAGGFAGLAALSMTRSVYHPAWLLGIAAIASGLAPRGTRLRALGWAAVPAAIVLLWCAKNAAMFGFFGLSSWGAFSLHRVAQEGVPEAEVQDLVRQGTLSSASGVYEFSAPEVFVQRLGLPDRETGVPALDRLRKETLTSATLRNPGNRNHWSYLEVAPLMARDAWTLIRLHPEAYARTVAANLETFLRPVADSQWAAGNRNKVYMVAMKAEALECHPVTWAILAAVFAFATFGLLSGRAPPRERLFLGAMLATVAWATALALLAETGENNRFRYETFVPMLLLSCWTGREAIGWARRVRDRHGKPRDGRATAP